MLYLYISRIKIITRKGLSKLLNKGYEIKKE